MSEPHVELTTANAPTNSFVIPDKRIVYMSVTKAACTSMRWMVADLAGEDPESFLHGTGATQTQLMTIHGGRGRWQHTPTLAQLDPAVLREIRPDNGWFVFAVVRNPWSRLWSAWQSKFLVQHAFYRRTYADEPFFPRQPESPQDVVEDFQSFVAARPWLQHPVLTKDAHFRTQSRSVAKDRVPYSRVYDVREIGTLLSDLHTHLEGLGQDQELYVPRANETPLAPVPGLFDGAATGVVEEAYAADLETFPGWWSVDDLKCVDTWSDDALANIRAQVAANERISALSVRAREIQGSLKETRKELSRAQARIAALEAPRSPVRAAVHRGRSLAGRVAGRLRPSRRTTSQ
ncbi:sulfotransferase family 2 domain-containing protein [Isoptericola sp. AK164]|uniref:sulfotransferase family 2 domain-containing protein n=1 Tax=Isoptericola sp. AK164 TaxID=3024246 RepID=UPI0024181881|nr:sulfotransferase family 2 domain-containing protein [Isoptericola sp. AK164]